MHVRPVLATALVAALPLAAAADAAPRKVCNLLGRDEVPGPGHAVNGDEVTIRSADIASDRRNLTAVVRLGSAVDKPGLGRVVKFFFSRSEEESYVIETQVWDGKPYRTRLLTASERYDHRPGDGSAGAEAGVPSYQEIAVARAVVDTTRHEVRMTVPMAVFAGTTVRPGARVDFLGAAVHRAYGFNREATPVAYPEEAPAGMSGGVTSVAGNDKVRYVLGTPSCVRPGA